MFALNRNKNFTKGVVHGLAFWHLVICIFKCSLSCHPYAASGETPTLDTIDSYMKKLHSIIVTNPQEHENLISTVRDVVNRLDR